jgi:hypothetical protein
LDSGRYGEIATYLPGRRINGVRIRPDEVTIGVIGRYPATIADITACVRDALGFLDRPVHVHVTDIAAPQATPSGLPPGTKNQDRPSRQASFAGRAGHSEENQTR